MPAPPVTYRASRRPRRTGRLIVAGTALSAVVVAGSAGTYLGLRSVFPWISLTGSNASPSTAALDAPVEPVASGPSDAEEVVAEIAEFRPAAWKSWEPSRVSRLLSVTSLGFGCDPKDGLAPVVATSRTWTSPGSSPITLSFQAYPAGGGAVALESLRAAALACDSTDLLPIPAEFAGGLGVEASLLTAPDYDVLVWRRGDVLVQATSATTTMLSSAASPLTAVDERLGLLLAPTCVDQQAGVEAAIRSPYLQPRQYRSLTIEVAVQRPDTSDLRTARDMTEAAPPQNQPAPARVDPVGSLPSAPEPVPTIGPDALPAAVEYPVRPQEPASPARTGQVTKQVPDRVGPGCGWEFTAQSEPMFDQTRARRIYERDKTVEERMLTKAWKQWQQARARYWDAYARYVALTGRYASYAEQVAEISAAWAVIESARAEYYAAYEAYAAAVQVREDFLAARDAAEQQYEAELDRCSGGDTDPGVEPTEGATDEETETPNPQPVNCPPVFPEILAEPVPTVPAKPVPEPEAQLPR